MSTDTAVTKAILENDVEGLAAITSYDDALLFLAAAGIDVVSSEEFGDGFKVVDKNELVNRPMIVLELKFSDTGDHGSFVIVRAVTDTGAKVIFTDGGSGVCEQAKLYASKGRTQGIKIPRGLIKSDYEIELDGKMTKASTFYFS